MPNYLSDMRPDFKPRTEECGKIRCYRYRKDLKAELAAKTIKRQHAVDLLEDMLIVREFEEMIIKLRSGAYEPIADFDYRGPTHVSIGQEAASVGSIAGIDPVALRLLHRYHWLGNIRELRNVFERAVVIARGDRIAVDDLFRCV